MNFALTCVFTLGAWQGVQAQIETPLENDAAQNAPDAPNADNGRSRRDENRRREQEKKLREMMTEFGVAELSVQDALIEHLGVRVRARVQARQLGLELYSVLRRPGLGDTEVHRLLAQYQESLDADRIERARADNTLNDKIDFRSQPRLEAMLMLFGIVGDNPVLIPFAPVRPNRPRPVDKPNNRRGVNRGRQTRNTQARLSDPDQWATTPPVAAPPVETETGAQNEITGVVVGHAPDGIIVQAENGEKRTFTARDNDGNDEAEASIARTILNFEVGARVRLRWVEDDASRVVSIERVRFDAAF